MHENMDRVESALSATSSGNLTWEQWPLNVTTAIGFASRSNPLGGAVMRYLNDGPSAQAVWDVIVHLATALIRRGYVAQLANKASWEALDAFNQIRCPHCTGRGVLNIEQQQCDSCHGTGERDISALPEIIRDGISALMEAERRMNGQLGAWLRDSVYKKIEPEDRYRLRVQPLERGMLDMEIDSNLPSGLHGRHASGG